MTSTNDDGPTPTEELLGRTGPTEHQLQRRLPRALIAVVAMAVIAVGGLGFLGGRFTAPAQAAAGAPGGGAPGGPDGFQPPEGFDPGAGGGFDGGGQPGGGGFPGFGGGTGPSVEGTVTAIDGDGVTVELANGQSVTVVVQDDTTVSREVSASRDDISVGTSVRVQVDLQDIADGGEDVAAGSVTIVD